MKALHIRIAVSVFFAWLVLPAASALADNTVTGKFLYEDRRFDTSGFTGPTDLRPIRFADVQIQVASTGAVLARGATAADGSFSIVVPGSTSQTIRAVCYSSSTSTAGLLMEVKSYSYGGFPYTPSSTYSFSSSTVTYPSTLDLGTKIADSGSSAGKAFNIWDVAYDGMEFLQNVTGGLPVTKLTIIWRSDGDSRSFYFTSSSSKFMHVGSVSGYDDTVIAHQFGHFVADTYSMVDSSASLPNSGVPTSASALLSANDDVRVAWAEGVSMFIGASIRKFKGYARPDAYVLTDGTKLILSMEIESLTSNIPLAGTKGSTSAAAVCAALWDITDGADTADGTPGADDDSLQRPFSDVWKVLTYIKSNVTLDPVTHPGFSVEDFWDGWSANNNGATAEMQTIFATLNGIEYTADSQEPDNSFGAAPTVSAAQFALSSGSRVVINEIATGSSAAVELFNAGDTDADLTGWMVFARAGTSSAFLTIPSYVLKAGSFVVLSGADGVNRSSRLYFNTSIPWTTGAGGACSLIDNSGLGRDFVRWGDSKDTPTTPTTFTGTNPTSPPSGKSLGRNHAAADTNSGADWTVQDPSFGDFNASGLEKHHTFYPAGDVDYVAFTATAGRTYVLETVNLTCGADTVLDLLAADGVTVLATNDDHGDAKGSRIVWTASSGGKFYLYSRRYQGPMNYARYGVYDVRIIESTSQLPSGAPEVLTVSKPGNGGMYEAISDALSAASNGDTIKIMDSETYQENLRISGKSVNLKAAGGRSPLIDARGSSGLPAIWVTNSKAVRIESIRTLGGASGIVVSSGSVKILNALVNRSSLDGIEVVGTGTSAAIVNSTVVNNPQAGVAMFGQSSARIVNSIITSNSQLDVGGDSAKLWTLTVKNSVVPKSEYFGKDGNIKDDPKFVNATGGDYHLAVGSPCIDKGDSTDADLPATDADGIPRSLDGNADGSALPDMGAFEYWSSSILTSTAVFPQVAVGDASNGEYRTAIYGMNTGSQAVIANVTLTRSDGNPLSVNLASGSGSSFNIVISPGGTLRLETSSTGDLAAGYAKFASNLGVDGSALFKVVNGDNVVSEAGVGLSKATRSFTVYIDNVNNAYSGYAIANFGSANANLTLTLRDKTGVQAGSPLQLSLPPGQHFAKFAAQHFPSAATAGFEGSIEVTSDQDVAAVALRYDNPNQDVFSTIPVLVNEAATTLYFPQVADGLGYRTNFILLNPSTASATATLEFYDNQGNPLSLPIGGSEKTSYTVDLNAKGAARFITDGTSVDPYGNPKVGWVRVSSPQRLGGSAIFQTVAGGIITSEAGVASSPSASHFTTYVESLGYAESGLAIANPNTAEVNITLNLRDTDGGVAATTNLKLPPLGHVAKFFTQWFPGGFDEFEGTLEVVASAPVTGVALRYDNLGANVFATLPVVVIP